jgi:hypothetical protein
MYQVQRAESVLTEIHRESKYTHLPKDPEVCLSYEIMSHYLISLRCSVKNYCQTKTSSGIDEIFDGLNEELRVSNGPEMPVTVAERSKSWTFFARSEAGIMDSNPTQGMDFWCVCAFFCIYVVLCLGKGLATSWSLVQGVLPSVNDQETDKSAPCSKVRARGTKMDRKGSSTTSLTAAGRLSFK